MGGGTRLTSVRQNYDVTGLLIDFRVLFARTKNFEAGGFRVWMVALLRLLLSSFGCALDRKIPTLHTMRSYTSFFAVVAALVAQDVGAFMTLSSGRNPTLLRADTWDGASSGAGGSIEQIEFKIYPDGRVEETVRGVKGNNCHKVTEKINKQLGKVVATSPTEEMFEEEVKVQQKIYQSESDWEGSSSW
eukprot:scaffold901_cov167-Amphora_coffeaeformis.AAC.13